ncbi:type II toxin-antitoxin system RelE/ParE family toxin [Scytonema sp. NUACC26]|uniref:type II toxin-antitoxin system RelE/ParE family toxin n=1 Tax=Scytonema sp. NUACC26 TaxID=3140176 RepID=UPI0034DCA394
MPSLNIKITPLARKDLKEILKYTQRRWGAEQKERYKVLLDTAIKRISEFPTIGKFLEGLPENCLAYYTGRHVIVYLVRETHLEIIRILYDGMDLKRHFPSE